MERDDPNALERRTFFYDILESCRSNAQLSAGIVLLLCFLMISIESLSRQQTIMDRKILMISRIGVDVRPVLLQ